MQGDWCTAGQAVYMHMKRGLVGMEGVVICAALFGHMLCFYSFCHSAQLTDYCNILNKISGSEQRAEHVCGDIIC